MERVSVVGSSGTGKTTLGRRLAGVLGVPFLELDSLAHQAGWTRLPRDEFRAEVRRVCAGDRWVVDGNYSAMVQDLVWDRADTVVWMDLPRWLATIRVFRRTFSRGVTRVELWNGNREQLRNLLSLDPERSTIVLAASRYQVIHDRCAAAMADPDLAHLRFVHLRTTRGARRFLAAATAAA